MDKSTKMKSDVLDLLKGFMMSQDGEKIKPKSMSVDIISGKPGESLGDVLDNAAERAESMDYDADKELTDEETEDEDEGKKSKQSMKDFFARK